MVASQQRQPIFTSISVVGQRGVLGRPDDVPVPGRQRRLRPRSAASAARCSARRPRRRRCARSSRADNQHLFAKEYSSIVNRSIDGAGDVPGRLQRLDGDAPTQYVQPSTGNNANNGLAQQIQTVARVIGARNAHRRQAADVLRLDGRLRHPRRPEREPGRPAGAALARARLLRHGDVDIGGVDMRNNVTLFTASDFGRTITSNGDGTDHGWGAHHFVIGGAVNGGEIYGRFPQFQLNTGTDAANNAYLPVTSVDTIGATLGKWFGVSDANLDTIFPNLSNFPRDLGFLNRADIRSRGRSTGSLRAARFSRAPLAPSRPSARRSLRLQDAPVLDRLGQMRRSPIASLPARSAMRARDPQHAVEARAPTSRAASRRLQEARRGGVERGSAGRARRRPARRCSRPGGRCASPGRRATRSRNVAARLAVGRGGELLGGDRRHLDLQVDAVEQRPADAALVARDRVGRAAAGLAPRLPSWPHGQGFIAATSWKRAGNSACRAARETTMRPVSSGSRSASSAARGNSGSSSRNSTPWWASEISPGRGGEPPPTSAAAEAVWCGARSTPLAPACGRRRRRPGSGSPPTRAPRRG